MTIFSAELDEYLNSDSHDGLNALGTHGFLCAAACAPTDDGWQDLFLENDDGAIQMPAWALQALQVHKEIIAQTLANEELPQIALDDFDSAADWSLGFVDAMHGLDSWFDGDEEEIAMLTLPMVALCDIDFEDSELDALREDDDTMADFVESLLPNLTELYLLFHSEE